MGARHPRARPPGLRSDLGSHRGNSDHVGDGVHRRGPARRSGRARSRGVPAGGRDGQAPRRGDLDPRALCRCFAHRCARTPRRDRHPRPVAGNRAPAHTRGWLRRRPRRPRGAHVGGSPRAGGRARADRRGTRPGGRDASAPPDADPARPERRERAERRYLRTAFPRSARGGTGRDRRDRRRRSRPPRLRADRVRDPRRHRGRRGCGRGRRDGVPTRDRGASLPPRSCRWPAPGSRTESQHR